MPRAWAGPTGHPWAVPRCVASLTPQNCPSRGLDGEWGVRVRGGTGRARLGGVLRGLPEVRAAPGGPEPGVAWAAGSGLERSIARAREATQGVGPARAARWRQSPSVPAAPSLGAEVKPSAGEAAGSQGCILGSRLGSLRGKLFSVEILKFSNIYQSRAKANPVSPIRPPMPPHPFYF